MSEPTSAPLSAAEANARLTTSITLKYPVTTSVEGTITELTINRPKVKDRRYAVAKGKNVVDADIHLFTQICNVSEDAILELDEHDWNKLQGAYEDFL